MKKGFFQAGQSLGPTGQVIPTPELVPGAPSFLSLFLSSRTYGSLFSEKDIDHPAKGRPQPTPQPSLRGRKPSQSRAEPYRW